MLRKSELKRTGRIKPKKRRSGEFYRIYGGKDRRRWVGQLPCVCCGAEGTEDRPNANHHTENGGQGRKADYHTIVSLCHTCHHLHHTGELGRSKEWWTEQARLTEEAWVEASGCEADTP